MAGKKGHRGFGHVRKLPSGRWQASYLGPDRQRHNAPVTFDTKDAADGWLSLQRADILRGHWNPGAANGVHGRDPGPNAPVTLRAYSATWLAGRNLSPTTRRVYGGILAKHILPALGDKPLTGITPVMVREWHSKLATGQRQRAAAYALLRTILATAVADDLIPSNPCRIRGAGQAKRARQIGPATLEELATITAAMPDHSQLLILLAAWCALRLGEATELRRGDIDTAAGVIHVRRGVVWGVSGRVVKDPKSQAGKRTVAIPPHLMPAVKDHLRDHTGPSQDALLFTGYRGGHLAQTTLYDMYRPAREAAGRPDLRFHDLRHTGAVLAAATGATLAELMARLGHSTVSAAMRYQHAAADRDRAIAEALSKLATVTDITAAKTKRKEASG